MIEISKTDGSQRQNWSGTVEQFEATSLPTKGWVTPPFIPVPVPPTPEQIIAELTAAVQAHLDTKAREKNYDGILSACTYVASTNPTFAAEGQACVEWRDGCWAKCYEVMAEVGQGHRPIPTAAELIAELPIMVWSV